MNLFSPIMHQLLKNKIADEFSLITHQELISVKTIHNRFMENNDKVQVQEDQTKTMHKKKIETFNDI